ncbi:Gfo/Idh/MocA family protein [Nitratireductor kimnyeongensis]|uniref:Gfo/Idh/MocA family protein n=1 Tax=Nitratireductor kimnyeongensis TaxID=430679 RepID=A0ABW0TBU4_9HYPH|nr:Gfo/Idh/MocA family oxidoreductase [Nitratireductor kimnyeongensis]QZZ35494.1 Gfo/Idh/MocA family oxidoreductase [Nitratireductor kimnyeongensis]
MSVKNVLLCGFGAFGAQHAAAWRQSTTAPCLYVSDPDPAARDRALAVGLEHVAEDPSVYLDRVDLVDIVTPPRLHLPVALTALGRGKHVFIEKPAVTSLDEGRRLMAAVETSGCAVQIGFVLRCHPLVEKARGILASGDIGRLLAVEGHFSGWKRMRDDSTILENDGVHFLDLMRHLAGVPVRSVAARGSSLLGAPKNDDIRIDLTFGEGISGNLRLGILACGEVEDGFMPGAVTTKRLRLIGDAGNIVIDFNRNTLMQAQVSYMPKSGGWNVVPGAMTTEQVIGVTPLSLLAKSFDQFVSAIESGGPTLCSADEGALEMASLLEAIDQALLQKPLPQIALEKGT